jgi:hypothetical protein
MRRQLDLPRPPRWPLSRRQDSLVLFSASVWFCPTAGAHQRPLSMRAAVRCSSDGMDSSRSFRGRIGREMTVARNHQPGGGRHVCYDGGGGSGKGRFEVLDRFLRIQEPRCSTNRVWPNEIGSDRFPGAAQYQFLRRMSSGESPNAINRNTGDTVLYMNIPEKAPLQQPAAIGRVTKQHRHCQVARSCLLQQRARSHSWFVLVESGDLTAR